MNLERLRGAGVDDALWAALSGQREFGVAACDATGLLIELNPTLQSMLGEPYQEAHPDAWPQLYHLYDEHGRALTPDEMPLIQALRGQRVADRVISTRPRDGSLRYLRCNGARLYDTGGLSTGAVLFVVDVTPEIVGRRELDALREQLVETINHEVRTPLAIVKGHAEFLEDLRGQLPAPATTSVDAIGRGLARLEEVLGNIRELAERTTSRRR